MFTVTEQGRKYQVTVRGAYRKSIRSEKSLRRALRNAMVRVYGEKAADKPPFEQDMLIGVIEWKQRVQ